jgi:Ca2+-transporting ATPase
MNYANRQNMENKFFRRFQKKKANEPWTRPVEKVLETLTVSTDFGLKTAEIKKRRRIYGSNRLQEFKRKSAWRILANQFTSLVVDVLALASGISFVFGRWVEGVAIGIALFINAVIGFVTELKATRSMEALHRLGSISAKVRREGEVREIPAERLVPGDMVILEAGDLIPADLRVVEANNLQTDESTLTGESVPVAKQREPVRKEAPLAERASMFFKGTAVTAGSGVGVVVAIGMDTELGKVASLVEQAGEEITPLEKRLAQLGRRLVWATLLVGAFVAVAGFAGGRDWLLVLETAIAMAVAAVPEGLPIVATIALARGMWRMAHRNALVNRLSSVETLGATTIICTDKTGTLTENRMTVARIALSSGVVEVVRDEEGNPASFRLGGRTLDPAEEPLLVQALEAGVLCNNASLGGGQDNAIGDPLEVALLAAGAATGMHRKNLLERMPEVREEAFSPRTKMMATCHKDEQGYRIAVKGAPEAVLEVCTRGVTSRGGADLSNEERKRWRERNYEMAEEGLRVLALGQKNVNTADTESYKGLSFLGLVGLWDPPRETARQAIGLCRDAGIRVIMVTGDHPATARAVAKAVKLTDGEFGVMEGNELKDPEELAEQPRVRVLHTPIFARVSPEQKLKLIAIHQKNRAIVAMTGDGVNDAPALKKADIGIAMGRRGTQVAKEAADMVLKDDEFSTIVSAVEYGRVIFENIRKFLFFLISGNVSQVLIITLASLVNTPLPLLPLQILYLNLVGDVFPALALGVGEGDPAVMKRSPRDPSEPILTRCHWFAVGGYSVLICASVLAAFSVALTQMEMDGKEAVTVSFLTLSFARLWHVFNMRQHGSRLILNEITRNSFIWMALAACIGLLLAAVYLPDLAEVLKLADPGAKGWFLILAMSLVPLLIGQAAKLLALGDKSGLS